MVTYGMWSRGARKCGFDRSDCVWRLCSWQTVSREAFKRWSGWSEAAECGGELKMSEDWNSWRRCHKKWSRDVIAVNEQCQLTGRTRLLPSNCTPEYRVVAVHARRTIPYRPRARRMTSRAVTGVRRRYPRLSPMHSCTPLAL